MNENSTWMLTKDRTWMILKKGKQRPWMAKDRTWMNFSHATTSETWDKQAWNRKLAWYIYHTRHYRCRTFYTFSRTPIQLPYLFSETQSTLLMHVTWIDTSHNVRTLNTERWTNHLERKHGTGCQTSVCLQGIGKKKKKGGGGREFLWYDWTMTLVQELHLANDKKIERVSYQK